MGNVLSNYKLKGTRQKRGEPDLSIGSTKLNELLQDPDFIKKSTPIEKEVQLIAVNEGEFSAVLPALKTPGTYQIEYKITGSLPSVGEIRRTETRSVVVGFGKFDKRKSKIQSRRIRPNYYGIYVKPQDVYGNLLGPDFSDQIDVKLSSGKVINIADQGDGGYAIYIARQGDNPINVEVGLNGQTWFDRKL